MAAGLSAVLLLLLPQWAGVQGEGQAVFDAAGLFTAEESQKLEERIESLGADMDWDVYVATTSDAGGKTARDFADDFYDDNGLGRGDDHSGLLLLIDMDNREAYITTTGEAISCYTNSRINSMLDSVTGYLKNQQYYKAADAFLTKSRSYAVMPSYSSYSRAESGTASAYQREPDSVVTETEPVELTLGEVILVAAFGGLLAAGGTFLGVYLKYSAKSKKSVYPFRQQSNMQLLRNEDRLINKTVHTRHIPRNDNNNHHSGGFGGGSSTRTSTHTSSSGTTHGGGGRGF